MAGRRFTRPRTRLYDYNYNLGESYYRSALDGLDRKYGTLPAETIEPPRRQDRPYSMGNIEAMLDERRPEVEAFNRELEEDMQSMKRISRARARDTPTAEEEFEKSYHQRRDEVKKRYSQKMLDSVGLNGSLEEESASLRRRVQRAAATTSEETVKLPVQKWSAITPVEEDLVDEWAAKARAKASRARLADIENEMEELSSRRSARERRLANLRDLLSESQEADSSSVRMKKTTFVTTTEKRMI